MKAGKKKLGKKPGKRTSLTVNSILMEMMKAKNSVTKPVKIQ